MGMNGRNLKTFQHNTGIDPEELADLASWPYVKRLVDGKSIFINQAD